MENLTPEQQRLRGHAETVIAVMAPALDLVLAAGERLSRLLEPNDYEYYPVRENEDPVATYQGVAGPEDGDANIVGADADSNLN